jgi:hypothetical protein
VRLLGRRAGGRQGFASAQRRPAAKHGFAVDLSNPTGPMRAAQPGRPPPSSAATADAATEDRAVNEALLQAATNAADMLSRKWVLSRELTEVLLTRIDAVNPAVNADCRATMRWEGQPQGGEEVVGAIRNPG